MGRTTPLPESERHPLLCVQQMRETRLSMQNRNLSFRRPPLVATADSIGIALVMLDVLDCSTPERAERRKTL